MFTFVPAPRNATEAAFQARVMDRAKTLLTDGYKMFFAQDVTGAEWCNVVSPEGKTYEVDFIKNTCKCACCVKHGFCKHLIAVHIKIREDEAARDLAQVEAYEAMMAACENERTGVDYLRY